VLPQTETMASSGQQQPDCDASCDLDAHFNPCCMCDRTHVITPIQVSWEFPRGADVCSEECRRAYLKAELELAAQRHSQRQPSSVPLIAFVEKFPESKPTENELEELSILWKDSSVEQSSQADPSLLSFDDMCRAIEAEEQAEAIRQRDALGVLRVIAVQQTLAIKARTRAPFTVACVGFPADPATLAIVDAKLASLQLQRTPTTAAAPLSSLSTTWQIEKLSTHAA
jgi:hypothetical protein